MATEVLISSRSSLPRDLARVQPGNATVTRYIKSHAAVVYIEKKESRFGYRTVAYYAPASIVAEAEQLAAQSMRQKASRAEKQNRHRLLGAAADQTLDVFLSFGEPTFRHVMREYKKTYGEKKAEYVRRVYSRWRTKQCSPSQELRERLLEFLPPFLPLDQKFEIIKAIYRSSLRNTALHFCLRSESDIDLVGQGVRRHLSIPSATVFEPIVYDVAHWLSQQDSQLCLALVERLKQEEEQLLSSQWLAQIQMLRDFVSTATLRSTATRVIQLPSLTVTIRVEK